MPFTFDLLDEEQKKKQDEADQGSFGAPAMTGGGASFTQGASQGPAVKEAGTNTQGSGFVNLDRYLDANKGSQFGQQFTGKVQSSVDNAKNELNQGAQEFSNASNQSTTRWNDVEPEASSIVSNAGDNTTQAERDKIKNWSSAAYQGPESFGSTASGIRAQGATQKAAQESKALQSEGGRFALLDQYFGRPTYNTGQKTLDNALVQNTPGVAAKAQSIKNQTGELQSQYGQTAQDMNNLAASNRQASADTASKTRDLVSGAMTGFKDDLLGRYSKYNQDIDAWNSARRADVSDDALDADTRAIYGLNPGDTLYDVNLSNYLNDSPKSSLQQYASDADYARYLALAQLAGEEPSVLTTSDRSKAGTGNELGKVSVDKSRLGSAIDSAKNAWVNSQLGTQQQTATQQMAALRGLILDQNNGISDWGRNELKRVFGGRYSDPADPYAEMRAVLNDPRAYGGPRRVGAV